MCNMGNASDGTACEYVWCFVVSCVLSRVPLYIAGLDHANRRPLGRAAKADAD